MVPSPPPSVSVRKLAKRYGPVEAVRGISFEVTPGEIFGLLGLNGAGKTTTLECILGLRQADAGTVTIGGIDALARPGPAKRRVGAQLQSATLQDKVTPRQALRLFGSFYPEVLQPAALLEQFGLQAKADANFDTLSGGQKQRLFLALALVNDPQLVVLDEPTAGLDPSARRKMHLALAGMKTAGRSVLLSTHHLDEAQQLCDRIGILHEGRIIALDTPAGLIARAKASPRLSFRTARPLDSAAAAALPGVSQHQPQADGWLLATRDVNRTISGLIQKLETDRNDMLDLQILRPSLEDVFIELTGRDWAASAREERP